jgi:hypothetical protein
LAAVPVETGNTRTGVPKNSPKTPSSRCVQGSSPYALTSLLLAWAMATSISGQAVPVLSL